MFYLYQDPLIAWDFTKKREKLEGRYIPREAFIDAFFNAKDNVQSIKNEFGDKIKLNLVIKNKQNEIDKIEFNINSSIDNFITISYNKDSLNKIIC